MGVVSEYWIWVRVVGLSRCQSIELNEVKAFFQQEFPQLSRGDDVSDRDIQRQLMVWLRHDDNRRQMAELCLRCFISNQLRNISIKLEKKFGKTHDLTNNQILLLVLDKSRRIEEIPNSSNISTLINRILETFDAEKSNLSTWTIRIFYSDREVKNFLLYHGIEQVTDWMILSYVTPVKLEKILKNNCCSVGEIQQSLQLLDAYHQIYRSQLLQTRKAGSKSRYPDPTEEQLRQIAEKLFPNHRNYSQDFLQNVRSKLENIANFIREERIRVRQGVTSINSQKSWDNIPEKNHSSEEEQSEFSRLYNSSFDGCFTGAVKKVVEARITYFQAKRTTKFQKKLKNFVEALHLFHCEGVPMTEIAPRLNLIDQPSVSRLLELKGLRNDIGRNTSLCLKKCILELIQSQIDDDLPPDWELKVQAFLDKEIQTVIQEAEQEARNGQRQAMNSKMARAICEYVCHYLNSSRG
ncbi:hypothetical protein IQ247_10010 [Plectonema cf. radiosum LEGE 06105]|uniref:Uncharacterized protein n=1 Tax=Plectonema cf. radiosum LEGE 06105 TaxID=945769 RepID=A0A8J7F6S8_9CYAN|nr:hypothetical protein [Plectonema radiosum]MBE9213009.1 hypothetical protein [Plectonema cf. radiosum LEGE 06105]